MQSTVGRGERSDAATVYLYPAVTRRNLHILIDTQVTKLLPANQPSETELPEFRVVEMAPSQDSKITFIGSNHELPRLRYCQVLGAS